MFKRKKQATQQISLENDVVMRVENLSKKFCRTLKRSIYYGTLDIARSMLGLQCKTWELRKDEFWALDDISFDLHKGETLGIIGVNGSGKSTLLRLITGIFPPDKGTIYHKGRVGALIAVGAGFHPHMTGRENICLNGTILGMTRKEIEAQMDKIIDFADIGDFLEAPVNTYSSGMRVRLGFSIAVHCEPDILLVDEVLSVGDINFRSKCIKRMNELRGKASIIFISHDMFQVDSLCSRCILIDKGCVVSEGKTQKVINDYYNCSSNKNIDIYKDTLLVEKVDAIDEVEVIYTDKDGVEKNCFKTGEDIIIKFSIKANTCISNIDVHLSIVSPEGVNLITVKSFMCIDKIKLGRGVNGLICKICCIPLLRGIYAMHFNIRGDLHSRVLSGIAPPLQMVSLLENVNSYGIVQVDAQWCQQHSILGTDNIL